MLSKSLHYVQALDNDLMLVSLSFEYDTALAANTIYTTIEGSGRVVAYKVIAGIVTLGFLKEGATPDTAAEQILANSFVSVKENGSSATDVASGSTEGVCDHRMLGAFASCNETGLRVQTSTSLVASYVGTSLVFTDLSGAPVEPADGTLVNILFVFKNSGLKS